MGKGEDSCDDASKARHGREDHESTSGIPVGWEVKQKKESMLWRYVRDDKTFIWCEGFQYKMHLAF